MATVLDLSVLKTFMPVFSWIFAFLLVYGFLEMTQIFRNRGIHAMLAFVFSVMVAVSGTATATIAAMAPWFLVVIFFIFIIYLIGNFMGLSSGDILGAVGGKGAVWWFIIIGFIILAAGLSQTFGQRLLEARQGGGGNETFVPVQGEGQPTHGQAVLLILTNPKVLGMLLLFFIAALTVSLMTGPVK
ncbi:hypothetical protein HY640_03000 [Candidatus Woesearchaeota archaeon]|nr:hypothetical protein [Candidatus Woesearchaeota archaeon]